MFKLSFERVSDGDAPFCISCFMDDECLELYFSTFEDAAVVFQRLLTAIGKNQKPLEKHIEESRQKIAEQEGA